MKLQVFDAAGQSVEEIDADDLVFGIEPNEPVVHQTLLAQLAARRSGSANTKSRGEVNGSTRKLRRQKGLGMARVGSANSPIRRGGGVAFGPHQRSYVQKLPKRMRRLAIRSVLSSRVAEGRLRVLSDFGFDQPSTQKMAGVLAAAEAGRSVLIVTGTSDSMVLRSARNLPGADVTPADTLNVADMLAHGTMLVTVDAIRRIEALWGGERASGRSPVAMEA
ncbi:MAG: 50S ribosomal protein L4 [Chloroflexi bacterium]|nr:50S ribosomal protein L4 [Chloroflexota bacterium]MDA1146916.1 50S ribosomal protein L4 [Chloroflexota bacterium]MQC82388.1 50S ribosomal protein L4 [Chloroflexota bacterium]MQC82970.1 50S ribosomal protein L4 [Chloroflexota bacterium]PKB56517.1 MAG: 50S ribosomal protein L4 [SAR202 cluster bacterium Casp-Chloro-G1]